MITLHGVGGQQTAGPVVWWLRNDLRLTDNPAAREAAAEASLDGRAFIAVFIFDPRFLDYAPYGRVTDPSFEKSIVTRRPVNFGNRKSCALRARFVLQAVKALADELAVRGAQLHVCYGLPEEIFSTLPCGSLVVCQQEPVSVECTDIENNVEAVLAANGGTLRREWGAMSLYHRDDLPFRLHEAEMPNSFTELGLTLGWDDIWSVAARGTSATPVRPPTAAPATFPKALGQLPLLRGLLPWEILADESAALQRLGYSAEEVAEALRKESPMGGEAVARRLLEEWLLKQGVGGDNGDNPQTPVFWDLPVGGGPGEGHDTLQWANLARPHGWMRISQYLAVGSVSAREIFARAASCPNFTGVVHRLLWREWHRLNAIRYGRRLFWLQGPGWVERPWTTDVSIAEAWRLGRTGVPYIDACMRELRETGWLAYKGRKTAGFFLVFGLGMDWRIGAYHFEDVLLDYDCAMNYGNWVTVAAVDKPRRHEWPANATITDVAEAYRTDIEFKLSAEMANDPHGEYVRKWVPELRAVPDAYVHMPWSMPEEEMARCGCIIGRSYPEPLMSPLHLFTEEESRAKVRREEDVSADGQDWGAGADAHGAGNNTHEEWGAPGGVNEDVERRVHPNDFRGHAYTRHEFLEYARKHDKPDSYGEKLWAQASPAPSEGRAAANVGRKVPGRPNVPCRVGGCWDCLVVACRRMGQANRDSNSPGAPRAT